MLIAVKGDSQSHSETSIPHDLAAVLLQPVSERTALQSLPLHVQDFWYEGTGPEVSVLCGG